MEVELDLGARAPPRQVAHGATAASGPDVVVLGVVEHFLADGEPLGSFFFVRRHTA